jgi:hypothetical protein
MIDAEIVTKTIDGISYKVPKFFAENVKYADSIKDIEKVTSKVSKEILN